MMRQIVIKLRSFFSTPDWMLRKDVFVSILCVPILFLITMGVFTTKSINRVKLIEREVLFLEKLSGSLAKKRNKLENLADDAYIKKYIEPMKFLAADRNRLGALCAGLDNKDLYSGIKHRLTFLQSKENMLHFTPSQTDEDITWHLKHSVEISRFDLLKILTDIEGMEIPPVPTNPYRPNIYFSLFKCKRINKGSSDVYTVDMEIIQKR